jgi:hypothetical protein
MDATVEVESSSMWAFQVAPGDHAQARGGDGCAVLYRVHHGQRRAARIA